MRATIHQPNYVPHLGYFHKIAQCETFIIFDSAKFVKNGFVNRNRIADSHREWRWLTLPVKRRDFNGPIRNVRIVEPDETKQRHLRIVESTYSQSKYFDEIYDGFKSSLSSSNSPSLSDLNIALLKFVFDRLGIHPRIVCSSKIEGDSPPENPTDRNLNLLKAVRANEYLSGPSGRNYLDESRFAQAGIALRYDTYTAKENPPMSVLHELFSRPTPELIDMVARP